MSKASVERDTMAHRKRVQGALSLTTATLGLSALGTKGGSVVLRRVAKHPRMVARAAGMENAANKIDSATVPLLTTSAGIGGVGGFNFAAIQRAEAKREKSPVAKAKTQKKQGLTPAQRSQKRKYQAGVGIGYGALTGATMAATPGLSVGDMVKEGKFEVNRSPWGIDINSEPEGMGHAFARHVKGKAADRPAEPEQPFKPPTFEEHPPPDMPETDRNRWEKMNERVKVNEQHRSQGIPTDDATAKIAEEKANSYKQKYKFRKVETDPGQPFKAAKPAGKAPLGWRAASKVIRGPKSATAAIYTGAVGGMTGLGVGLGTLSARSERKRHAKIQGEIRREVARSGVVKSAFGVVHKAEKSVFDHEGIKARANLNDEPNVAAQVRPAPRPQRRYPESGNFDPEVQRKNRARKVQNTATATAGGLTVAGVASHPRNYIPAARGLKDAAGDYGRSRRAAGEASKIKFKSKAQEPNFGRRMGPHHAKAQFTREAGTFKNSAKAKAATSVKSLFKLKPKVLAGAGVAGAVAMTTGMLRRDKAHRSYSDWWDAT
jgi:hypothetical protein